MVSCFCLIVFVVDGVFGGGYIQRYECIDKECCRGCSEVSDVYNDFDGVCNWNGEYAQTYECIPYGGNSLVTGNYRHSIYEDRNCENDPVVTYKSNRCYPNYETDGSFYFQCRVQNLFGNKNNDANKEDVGWYLNTIAAMLVSVVFLCGIIGGYCVYKKRKCHQNQNDTPGKHSLLKT